MTQKAKTPLTATDRLIKNLQSTSELYSLNRLKNTPAVIGNSSMPLVGGSAGGNTGPAGNFIKSAGDTMVGPIAFYPISESIENGEIDIGQNSGNYSSRIIIAPESGSTDNLVTITGAAFAGQLLILQGVDTNTISLIDAESNQTDWAISTVYGLDDIVDNDGLVYVCKSAHTSAAADEPGVGANWEDKWFRSNIYTIDGTNFDIEDDDNIIFVYDTTKVNGGWQQVTIGKAAAAGNLTDPMTTAGDIIIRDGTNTTARLGIGSAGQVLQVSGGLPAWAAAPGGGNPPFDDNQVIIQDETDNTKTLTFTLTNNSANDANVIDSTTTASRTWTMPDATTDIAGLDVVNQVFTENNIFEKDVAVGQSAVTAGKTLAVTMPDDTISEGVIFQNSDGSIQLINGTGTANEFTPVVRGTMKGDDQIFFIDGVVPAANDGASDTSPMIKLRGYRDTPAAVVNKPIVAIENLNSVLWQVDADGNQDWQSNDAEGARRIGFSGVLAANAGADNFYIGRDSDGMYWQLGEEGVGEFGKWKWIDKDGATRVEWDINSTDKEFAFNFATGGFKIRQNASDTDALGIYPTGNSFSSTDIVIDGINVFGAGEGILFRRTSTDKMRIAEDIFMLDDVNMGANQILSSGNITAAADSTYNIGTNGFRFSNVYTDIVNATTVGDNAVHGCAFAFTSTGILGNVATGDSITLTANGGADVVINEAGFTVNSDTINFGTDLDMNGNNIDDAGIVFGDRFQDAGGLNNYIIMDSGATNDMDFYVDNIIQFFLTNDLMGMKEGTQIKPGFNTSSPDTEFMGFSVSNRTMNVGSAGTIRIPTTTNTTTTAATLDGIFGNVHGCIGLLDSGSGVLVLWARQSDGNWAGVNLARDQAT